MKACDPIIAAAVIFLGLSAARAQDVSFGERLFRDKADCQSCHGINGDGRGDPRSPGRAANLHETRLNREQLIEVIACGRPGTEMPHFDKYAYEDTDCYGLKGKDLGSEPIERSDAAFDCGSRMCEFVSILLVATSVGCVLGGEPDPDPAADISRRAPMPATSEGGCNSWIGDRVIFVCLPFLSVANF